MLVNGKTKLLERYNIVLMFNVINCKQNLRKRQTIAERWHKGRERPKYNQIVHRTESLKPSLCELSTFLDYLKQTNILCITSFELQYKLTGKAQLYNCIFNLKDIHKYITRHSNYYVVRSYWAYTSTLSNASKFGFIIIFHFQ